MPDSFFVEGILLAFDFGLKRIGVATGDSRIGLAHPCCTLEFLTDRLISPDLVRLVQEWKPVGFVVGLPSHADDRVTEHPLHLPCMNFGQLLADHFFLPVSFINEQLSSYAAEHYYRQHHQKPCAKTNKKKLDAYAAQCILQDFFNGSPSSVCIRPSSSF
jgi:putative holliday junction resolvase